MYISYFFERKDIMEDNNQEEIKGEISEEINEIDYLKEVDYNTLEVKSEIKYFVAIVSDKYHEIASEFP